MKTDFELIQDVSCEFNRILSEWLTVDEIDEVIRRNKTDEYDGICATHDFCDSNVAMDEAFSKIMGYNASDKLSDERTITIWNAAWNLSKSKSFGRKQTPPTFSQFILSRTPLSPTEQTTDTLYMSGDFHLDQCETIFSYMNNRCYLVKLKSDGRFGVLLGIDEYYSENIIDIERELYGWYIDEFHS